MQALKKPKVKINLNKREKILASILMLLTIFFLYYQYVFAPQAQKIAAIKKDIVSKEGKINQLTSQGYGSVSQLTSKTKELDTEIGKLYEQVPDIKDLPGLLVDFYTSASKSNVIAKTISFGKLEAKDNYSSFSVSLDVTGTKRDVYNFIEEIENYPRLSKIVKIEFEPGENNLILAKISDEFYVLNDVKADPLEYPFVDAKQSLGFLFDIFNQYKVTGGVDSSGNLIVRDKSKNISNNKGQQTGGTGNTSGNVLSPKAAGSTNRSENGGQNANLNSNDGFSNSSKNSSTNTYEKKSVTKIDPWLGPSEMSQP